ncbi:hypothetical protein FRC05_011698 [Tulasnella sp. 425]|nr:hypothetical protein FRC05_011698 [Tulasnella sp. 425]
MAWHQLWDYRSASTATAAPPVVNGSAGTPPPFKNIQATPPPPKAFGSLPAQAPSTNPSSTAASATAAPSATPSNSSTAATSSVAPSKRTFDTNKLFQAPTSSAPRKGKEERERKRREEVAICKSEPDNLSSLNSLGIKHGASDDDNNGPYFGSTGRSQVRWIGTMGPPAEKRPVSTNVGLGLNFPGSKSGSAPFVSMGNFSSTASRITSEERLAPSNNIDRAVSGGSKFIRNIPMSMSSSQSGVGGIGGSNAVRLSSREANRLRSQRGRERKDLLKHNTTRPSQQQQQQALPGPLDLFSTQQRAPLAPDLPSALPFARKIDDLDSLTYPEGIKTPSVELIQDQTKGGKYNYDRDFLLQFMAICKDKPDNLSSLEGLGIERGAGGHDNRGPFFGSGGRAQPHRMTSLNMGRRKRKDLLKPNTTQPSQQQQQQEQKALPGPLDLSSTQQRAPLTPDLPSPLAFLRKVDDLNSLTYPEGIKTPSVGSNQDQAKGEKYKYDRDFLLQFMVICKDKPDSLSSLDALGIERGAGGDDANGPSFGSTGRNQGRRMGTMGPPARNRSKFIRNIPMSIGPSSQGDVGDVGGPNAVPPRPRKANRTRSQRGRKRKNLLGPNTTQPSQQQQQEEQQALPGPLDLSSTQQRAPLTPDLPSVLASAGKIDDLNSSTYPEGIKTPSVELN